MGEEFFAKMPNDPPPYPPGPTTDTGIFGKFFKAFGGIDPTTGQNFPLKDSSAKLDDRDVVQFIWVGPNGEIDFLNAATRMPGGDDVFLDAWGVNEGMYPSTCTGVFRRLTTSFDSSSHGRPAQGDEVYVRLFNSDNVLAATHYGDSPTYTVSHVAGESLSVFYDDQVDCDIPFPPSDARDFTIYGGLNPDNMSYWPLVDIYGLRLHDGDLIQLIWAGPDGLMDEMDEFTGLPTDDDSLLATFGIGYGYAGIGIGRFKFDLYTYETHTKGGYPAQGDNIYLRSFDDSTVGEDSEARWYGETPTCQVQWDFGEEFYSFPDSAFDDTTQVPWYRTLKIYGGLDSSMTEHPLTDSSGVILEDGDLVQLIWAGPDSAAAAVDSTGMPSGDDSLLVTWAVGHGYGTGTGLFKAQLRAFSGHKGGFPARGDFLYLRVFSCASVDSAKWYGESELHRVGYEQGERFFCFSDSEADATISNPAYSPVAIVEWASATGSLPAEYFLQQNCPNPFNPATEIRYAIPENMPVSLKVYNILGAEVATLVEGPRAAGLYTVRWNAEDLASGVYFCRLQAGEYVETVKMVLLR